MVTLQQVEPRAPISPPVSPATYPITISASGSYYLTGNLTVSSGDAIDITASGVTLDLNGFTITSTATGSSGSGVAICLFSSTGNTNITIVNGHILGDFSAGIQRYSYPDNVRISGVSVCGCADIGIDLDGGYSTIIESCTVSSVAGIGISAEGIITRCTVFHCGIYGIAVGENSSVIACTSTETQNLKLVEGTGIYVVGNFCLITGNICNYNSFGIVVDGYHNRIDSNTAGGNLYYGIEEDAPNGGNSITRNFAPFNGLDDYSGNAPDNPDFAPVQTPATATSPWANF
jgi:hypothetical protein